MTTTATSTINHHTINNHQVCTIYGTNRWRVIVPNVTFVWTTKSVRFIARYLFSTYKVNALDCCSNELSHQQKKHLNEFMCQQQEAFSNSHTNVVEEKNNQPKFHNSARRIMPIEPFVSTLKCNDDNNDNDDNDNDNAKRLTQSTHPRANIHTVKTPYNEAHVKFFDCVVVCVFDVVVGVVGVDDG